MKKFYTFLSFLCVAVTFAQIPAGYYSTATGTGYTLKTQLFNIINGHTDRGYDGLWTMYGVTDRDHSYDDDNTILDVYSENPTGPDPYSFDYQTSQCGTYSAEGGCYNREHTVPQSYFGSQATPMYSDAHFVLPTDGKVNGWRDDHPYGIVAGTPSPCNIGASNTPCRTLNGSKLGLNRNSGYSAGYSQKVFEPIDEFKGDIARCLLYFATRYESQLAGFYAATSSEAKVMFDGTSDHVFSPTFLNILLTWNTMDPVSAREITRNNAIGATSRQGNRNPFIDHPEYACQIWSAACLALSNENFTSVDSDVSVFPNPANNHQVTVSSQVYIDTIQLFTINGQLLQEIKNPNIQNNGYTLENLPSGFFFMKITSNGTTITKKLIVN